MSRTPPRNPLAFIWPALGFVLVGWVIALMGFSPQGQTELTDALGEQVRYGLRVLGFCMIVPGTILAVALGLRWPILLIVGGILVNLAYEARAVTWGPAGIVGAMLVLGGCMWGSREIRRMRAST